MVSTKELVDDNSSISSTRWAFVSVIKFDIVMIFITILAYIISHFTSKPLGAEIFTGVTALLGVLTAVITASKVLQGFETK